MKVLFLCSSNVFRSQMAEAFFNKYSKGYHESYSAALITPQDKMHSLIIRAMKEIGIDITSQYSKKVTQEMIDTSDLIILMNPNLEEYTKNINKPIEIWDIPDVIAKETDEYLYPEFVKARNIIERNIKSLLKKLS